MKMILCFIYSHDLGDFFLSWADFLRQISTSGLENWTTASGLQKLLAVLFFFIKYQMTNKGPEDVSHLLSDPEALP